MDFSLNYDASILPDIDLNMLFGEMGYLMNIGLEPNALWDPHIFSEHSSPATTTDLDVYDAHASFLRPELFKVVQSFQLPENSPEYRRAVEAVESVTGDILQRFTNSFFRHWHKHGPFIHIPSYSPGTCATVLILAMSCIGGLYVKDPGEIRRCRALLDIAEVYIYGRDYLKNEYEFCAYGGGGGNNSGKTYKDVDWEDFEKLQAAYLMIVVQTWAGHKIAKRRIRQQRFARVLEVYYLHISFPTSTTANSYNTASTPAQATIGSPHSSSNFPYRLSHLDSYRNRHPIAKHNANDRLCLCHLQQLYTSHIRSRNRTIRPPLRSCQFRSDLVCSVDGGTQSTGPGHQSYENFTDEFRNAVASYACFEYLGFVYYCPWYAFDTLPYLRLCAEH